LSGNRPASNSSCTLQMNVQTVLHEVPDLGQDVKCVDQPGLAH
jgi:hypothetical protein